MSQSCELLRVWLQDRMDYVQKLQVSLEAFCEMEEKAVMIQRAWRARCAQLQARQPPTPEWQRRIASIPRSNSTDMLIRRTKKMSSAQLKPSLRKSQEVRQKQPNLAECGPRRKCSPRNLEWRALRHTREQSGGRRRKQRSRRPDPHHTVTQP